jgi:serine-type D-Ala-D-Ala carboxypeptidase/endopeptidase (penicillin-binding protein 4)
VPVLRHARARVLALIAGVVVASALVAAAPPPAHALDAPALRARLSREMLRSRMPFSGAYVRDLDTGTALYARNEDVARPPASVEKLYTTSTALLRFGADTRLHTQVLATGAIDPLGVWRGDLYLRGAGDPTLGQPQIVALANSIAATGIHRVSGSVLGDESAFDSLRGSSRTGFALDRDITGVLSGVAVGRGFSRDGSPPKEAARRLAKALRAAGVAVDGKSGAGTAPDGTPELTGIDSPPMADLIRLTNVPSDNFDAEMLLKDIGVAFGGAGTTNAGIGVVRAQLATFGVHPRIVDGSGLSRANRTTPRQVVRLLERMHGSVLAPQFAGSLPVVGRTGTMRRRMRGTVAQDRCQTKTGTLRAISALAGYCTTAGGHTVAFAILMSTVFITRAHGVQDRMTQAIATYGTP